MSFTIRTLKALSKKYNFDFQEGLNFLQELKGVGIYSPMTTAVRTPIDVDKITEDMISSYPEELIDFAKSKNLKLHQISSGNGKAMAAMAWNPDKYFTPKSTGKFCTKFDINSRDPIQLFNKKEQDGFKMGGGRAQYCIVYPYKVSNKKAMRENFKFDGTEEEKNKAINKIKANIQEDYLDPPNEKWQLGHKNPETTDNTSANLVLQPPIQAKYRDRYIFIDTLTKIPTPTTFFKLYNDGKLPYTVAQIRQFRDGLNQLVLS